MTSDYIPHKRARRMAKRRIAAGITALACSLALNVAATDLYPYVAALPRTYHMSRTDAPTLVISPERFDALVTAGRLAVSVPGNQP